MIGQGRGLKAACQGQDLRPHPLVLDAVCRDFVLAKDGRRTAYLSACLRRSHSLLITFLAFS